jgi:tripartite-type tricarboxylate transporter receptor subunit TctC
LRSGARVTAVPYKGTGPMLADLVSGVLDAAYLGIATAVPQLRDGRLRALALASTERSRLAPDVPTLREAGITEAEFAVRLAAYAPAATPGPVLQLLSGALRQALRAEAVAESFARQGIEPMAGTPEELRAIAQQENARMAEVISRTGMKPE